MIAVKMILGAGKQKRVGTGHPWVFDNEIERMQGNAEAGDIVDVLDSKGGFIGQGYWNPASTIRVRLLTRDEETVINADWVYEKLEKAWQYRRRFLSDTDSCRVVFAESDGLPGLVVDKFSDVLVLQSMTLGMEKMLPWVLDGLEALLHPQAIYARNDVPVREREGLTQQTGFLRGHSDTMLKTRENGIPMWVDIANGQKTGHFMDQRSNRAALKPLCEDAQVLDMFCHTGAFALHALAYGARHVTAVDASADALGMVKRNMELNRWTERYTPVEANAFDLLRQYQQDKRRFDTVILDPPAFAKSRSALSGALRGYKEINLRGIRLLNEGGFLVTCSCSQHVDEMGFRDIVRQAAADAGRTMRQVAFYGQAVDHPALAAAPETRYLKCWVLQVIG